MHSGGIKTSDAAMLMGGGAAVGAGLVLLWAAHTHSGDADDARSVKDYERISGRSTGEYILGGVAIVGGVALSMWALKRIRSSKEADTAVAFTPGHGGGTLVLERSW